MEWDSQYRLTAVYTNGTLAESYGYDALGRRAWISDGTTTNYLVYDGLHVIAEVGPSGSLGRSYTWGPGVDNLLSFTDYTGGETNTYYAIKDHLGSVTAITDTDGAIVESYTFDAFGNVLGVYDSSNQPISESLIGNRYTFQGREISWATGLYCFRARWYDPVTGRWLSKDPIGILGGLNQYVACGNCPTMFRDALGLKFGYGVGVSASDKELIQLAFKEVSQTTAGRIIGSLIYNHEETVFVYASHSTKGFVRRGQNGEIIMCFPVKEKPGKVAHEMQHALEELTGQDDPAGLGIVSALDPSVDVYGTQMCSENRATRVENIVNDQYYAINPPFFYPVRRKYTDSSGKTWDVPEPFGTQHRPIGSNQ